MIVRATFVFSPAKPLAIPEGLFPISQGNLSSELVVEDDEGTVLECTYPGDFADFKPRPEVMVRGLCHPPKDHPAKEHVVRVSVGKWSKGARVPALSQVPFGPISEFSTARTTKRGKDYGAEYRATRSPYYSTDFNWSYFNSAPEDQWLELLRGDEQVTLSNMHPEARSFSKQLPGVRLRAFVKGVKGAVREVRMPPDTLFVDVEAERLYLTYRGLIEVAESDLTDVHALLLATEKLTEVERPAADYHVAIENSENGADSADADVPEHLRDLARAIRKGEKLERSAAPSLPGDVPQDPLSAYLARKLGHLAASERAKMSAAIAQLLKLPTPGGTSLHEHFADAVRKIPEPSAVPRPVSAASPRAPVGPILAKVTEQAALAGKRAADAGAPAPGLEALHTTFASPKVQSLDPGFRPSEAADSERLEPGADLRGRDLRGRNLNGIDLRGADLSDALLSGAKLRGTLFSEANLTRCALDGADLSGADLSKANLTLASLVMTMAEDADLRGAILNQVNGQKAAFPRANFAGAEGTGAIFEEAVFKDAKCAGSIFREAVFDRAELENADFTRAELVKCRFLDVRATKVNLERANLSSSSFAGAVLVEARLIEASGKAAIFTGSKLDRADFRFSRFPESHFSGATGENVTFRAADLRGCRFYRSNLPRGVFSQANLFAADLCKAHLLRTRFDGANLYDAKFLEADSAGADFSGAITKRSTLENQ